MRELQQLEEEEPQEEPQEEIQPGSQEENQQVNKSAEVKADSSQGELWIEKIERYLELWKWKKLLR